MKRSRMHIKVFVKEAFCIALRGGDARMLLGRRLEGDTLKNV